MDSLKSRLTDLSPEKRELLEALQRKKKAAAAAAASIPPWGDLPGPFPLSFAQERLWLVDQPNRREDLCVGTPVGSPW